MFAAAQPVRSPLPPPPPPPAPSFKPPAAAVGSTGAVTPHVYQTPFGKLSALPQSRGGWTAKYEFAKPGVATDQLKSIVAAMSAQFGQVDAQQAADLGSYDEISRQVSWKLGAGEDLVPLSSLPRPLSPTVVEFIVDSLTQCARQLEARKLSIGDFHPSRIFVDRRFERLKVIPSLWLAAEIGASPSAVGAMPCVAPEWSDCSGSVDIRRADVYGLGALAWLLLTGDSRKSSSDLPSDRSAAMAEWDAFIDGCCRTNPARRFADCTEAMAALKTRATSAGGSNTGSGAANGKKSLRSGKPASRFSISLRKLQRLLMTAAAAGIVTMWVVSLIANRAQPYERGVADTIIRYAPRDYSKCKWTRVEGTETNKEKLGPFGGGPQLQLRNVVGWDDATYWVVGSAGGQSVPIVRFHEKASASKSGPVIDASGTTLVRLLTKDKLLLAVRDKVYECTEAAKEMGSSAPGNAHVSEASELCPIGEDSYYLFMRGNHPQEICSQFSNGKREDTIVGRGARGEPTVSGSSQNAYVYDKGDPLRDFPTAGIKFTRTRSSGYAVGLAVRQIGHGDWQSPRLVRYDKGSWFQIREIPKPAVTVNAVWYAFSDDEVKWVFLACDNGYVYKHDVHENNYTVDVKPLDSSMDTMFRLVQIWGASEQDYWTMDDNGNVWHVVEGKPPKLSVMRIEDPKDKAKVTIRASWVSPTGTVIAITDKHIYRLDTKSE